MRTRPRRYTVIDSSRSIPSRAERAPRRPGVGTGPADMEDLLLVLDDDLLTAVRSLIALLVDLVR
jgi:hypothetical protein